jgi:hypothetical protein
MDCQIQCSISYHFRQGTAVCGAVWAVLCKQTGVHHIEMPVYHSREMGSLRVQCWLKAALRARNVALLEKPPPWVMLELQASPKDNSGLSSAELDCGCKLV